MARVRDLVPLRTAVRAWFLISLQTFGGPAGQIAVMQRTLVDERRWIGEKRFLHALNYCMLLPGPEAQQLAIYVGWLLNGAVGGLIAGILFVLPGLLAMLALSVLYVAQGDTTLVSGLFLGLAPAVLAIVVQAVLRIGARALRNRVLVLLAVAAFLALALFGIPFPLVVLGAGLLGWAVHRWRPALLEVPDPPTPEHDTAPLLPDDALHEARPSRRRNLAILGLGLVVWVTPVLLVVILTSGTESVFVDQGVFFGGMALVTFGGAYAVLSYVAQAAVQTYGWLSAGEMVRGLALAETTPGPLIMVVQFVAFLGAYRDPGTLDPWVAGVLGSLLVVWVTLRRTVARQPVARRCADRRHGGRRRGDREPRAVLRRAHALQPDPDTGPGPGRAARSGVVVVRLGDVRHRGGRDDPRLPLPLVGAPGAGRLRAAGAGGHRAHLSRPGMFRSRPSLHSS
jgi:chromate transporter